MDDDGRKRFRYVSQNPSQFISATVNVSSDSVSGSDKMSLGVGGHMYNDIQDGGLPRVNPNQTNGEGSVYGEVELVINDDNENFIQYCAWRSNTVDFSSSTELNSEITDAEQCPRFNTALALDTDYKVSVSLDKANGTIVYTVDDETMLYQIATGIFLPSSYWQGISADVWGDSKLIGFADDLAYSANPVPLADSETLVGFTESSNSGDAGMTGGSDSSSGGGGCSIGGTGGGLQAPLILLGLLSLFRLRRRNP